MENEYRVHKVEIKEPMYMTWGRIMTRIMHYTDDTRLKELAEKFNGDMLEAKVVENAYTSFESTIL